VIDSRQLLGTCILALSLLNLRIDIGCALYLGPQHLCLLQSLLFGQELRKLLTLFEFVLLFMRQLWCWPACRLHLL
jgi:hypothetical protein